MKDTRNKKPGPKNPWWKLKQDVVEKVMFLREEFREIATNYVIGVKAGISASSVGNIWKKYFGPRKKEKRKMQGQKSCEWLKKHVCWAVDTIKIPCKDGYVYAQMVIEEYSRCVLGSVLSHSNTSEKAVMLLESVVKKYGIQPLVVKTDRGSEFVNEKVRKYLLEKGIAYMPSPGHYPLFNGKLERENSIFRRYLKTKGVLDFEEISARIEKAIRVINHELPRMIFNGKTSADIFEKGEIYNPEEKEMLMKKVNERLAKIQEMKKPGIDELGILRKSVVKCIVEMGLCSIKSGGKNVNLLAV